jgi:hypothetical protein
LSRLSVEKIRQHVISQDLVAEIGGDTLWRWLSSDALRPWKHRSWIFPPDPNFAGKVGPILDLYRLVWEGAPLGADDYVLSAYEKASIQASCRKQPTLPLAPNRSAYVEHEYFSMGAWTYLAAWDVHQARVFGRFRCGGGDPNGIRTRVTAVKGRYCLSITGFRGTTYGYSYSLLR